MAKQFDIKQTGLRMFFKEWHIPLVHLIESDRFTEINPLRSKEALIHLHRVASESNKRSRASVIFFLQDLEEMGWLASRKQSGRGGMHDVYWKKVSLGEFIDMRIRSLSGGVDE